MSIILVETVVCGFIAPCQRQTTPKSQPKINDFGIEYSRLELKWLFSIVYLHGERLIDYTYPFFLSHSGNVILRCNGCIDITHYRYYIISV